MNETRPVFPEPVTKSISFNDLFDMSLVALGMPAIVSKAIAACTIPKEVE